MRGFISFFIKYPIWANAIIIVTALAGIINMVTMNQSFFPELDPNKITVTVAYPGASPREIADGITTIIEEALVGIEGIKEVTSKSQENFARIEIESHEKVNIDVLSQEVKNAIDGINSFPTGAERPIVVAQKSRGMGGMGGTVGFLSIQSDKGLFALKDMADKIEKELLQDPNISQLKVLGYPPQIIAIDINEQALLQHGLTFDQVSQKVKMQNLDISAGSLKTNEEELYIRLMNKSTDAEMIKNIVIKTSADGQMIRLGDIADVNFEFSDVPIRSYVNGKQNVTILVEKLNSEHLGKISTSINNYVDRFNAENDDFKMQILFMFSDLLDQRIDMLTKNLVIGLLLVCIVLGLFLSLRLSVWVAFGIPFSMLGMFWIGGYYGMSINMISLFGMILVVGILVDDGIVIAESIYAEFEKGKNPIQAAIDGTTNVLSSVFTSVLTTIVAFGFLMFVGGEMAMMEEMAFSVVACLAFSLIEAFLILPAHLASKHVLEPVQIGWYQKFRKGVERFINSARDGYSRWVSGLIGSYRISVWFPFVFMFFVAALIAVGFIKTAFFPAIPFNDIQVDIAYQPGDREMKTEQTLIYIESIVNEYNAELKEKHDCDIVKYVSRTLGSAQRVSETGSHAGSLRISVLEQDYISTTEISNELKNRIHPDTIKKLEKFAIGGDTPFGQDLSLSLQSKDPEEIKLAAKWLKDQIMELPEVKDISDNAGVGNRELWLELYPKAYALGLDEMMILNQVRQGFFGQEVQRLIVGSDEVKVWTRYPESDRNDFDDLEKLRIKTPMGQEFPLNTLANYEIKRGEVTINHIDGKQEVRVYGSLYNSEKSADVTRQIMEDLYPEMQLLYPGVTMKLKGQAERAASSMVSLLTAFGLGILLILIILSLNFASFYQARLIMMVVPIGIFSALLGHGLQGIPFSIFSFWGVIALVGILVNDAVVMLDKYNKLLKEGYAAHVAVVEAGRTRFRPIILTSLTTVAGLGPLVFEKSFQAQFLVPMAVSVAYGVFFGTLFLLFFFPSLLLYFNDMRRARLWLWRGGEIPPSKIEVEPVYKIAERKKEMGEVDDVVFFDENKWRVPKNKQVILDNE
jgi:multidrug efflux pump subunit AcrB